MTLVLSCAVEAILCCSQWLQWLVFLPAYLKYENM